MPARNKLLPKKILRIVRHLQPERLLARRVIFHRREPLADNFSPLRRERIKSFTGGRFYQQISFAIRGLGGWHISCRFF
jgi:hypothetical protein